MNSAVSLLTGASKKLDGAQQPDEIVTPDDASDATKLARLLTRILKDVAALKRQYLPRTITFRDIITTGTPSTPQTLTLTHRMGAPVEWTVVRFRNSVNTTFPFAIEFAATDATALVLTVYYSATISVQVREAG